MGDQILGTISELSVKQYEKALSKLIEENFDKNSPCRRCEKCQKYLFEERQISYVTINTSNYCNSKCIAKLTLGRKMKVIIQFHFWRISRGIENFLKIVGLIGGW